MLYAEKMGKTNKATCRIVLTCCFVLLIILIQNNSLATASEDDTIQPYASSSFLYDSNFLRLSDSTDPVAVTGKNDKSELQKVIAAGVDLDWKVSNQNLLMKANINQNFFQNFNQFDYLGWDTQVQWNWQVTSKFNGEIGYANREALGNFSQLNGLIANLRNDIHYFADANYLFHPNGKIKIRTFRIEGLYDDRSRQISNSVENDAELSLQYLSNTGTILGLQFQVAEGHYPNRPLNFSDHIDNEYNRYNYAATWDWHFDSKLIVDGLLGYTQQNYPHFTFRNFDSVVGRLGIHWLLSEKTLVDFIARRDISQAQNVIASFMKTEGVELIPAWQISPKILMKLPFSYTKQKFAGESGIISANILQQVNNTGSIGLNMTYKPIDNISISSQLNYENRDSNFSSRAYTDRSALITLQAAF